MLSRVSGLYRAARRSGVVLACVGAVVHLVLCYSVIDIHFQTPITHGIEPVQPAVDAPAKRIVLIVADGLRPDYLFKDDEEGKPLAPFLRYVGTCAGRFGVSHSRPPTESRPGHVALTAGFYEDPSALFSGWEANPVPFDSVFNHVAGAWGFGSPDVVPMWAGHGNYTWAAYDAAMEDWSTNTNLFELDTWVFNHTRSIIDGVFDGTKTALRKGPAIVFYHLLGLDSHSHAHGGPHAQQYLDNIGLIDRGIGRMVEELESVFRDGTTTYIVTSDHGMTDQASHGDASPESTRTPYVIWGAGISPDSRAPTTCITSVPDASRRKPTLFGSIMTQVHLNLGIHDVLGWRTGAVPVACGRCHDVPWGMDSPLRADIHQAQIAPLMSALLGVPSPVNGLFMLPTSLLSSDVFGMPAGAFPAQAAWACVRTLLNAYDTKAAHTATKSLFFFHYSPLTAIRTVYEAQIVTGLRSQDYATVQPLIDELGRVTEAALRYVQRYHWLPLYVTVVVSYLAWMACLIIELFDSEASDASSEADNGTLQRGRPRASLAVLAATASVEAVLFSVDLPATYHAYVVLLGSLLCYCVHRGHVLEEILQSALHSARAARANIGGVVATALLTAAGFHYRFIFALIAPALTAALRRRARPALKTLATLAGGLFNATALCTFLPTRKTPSTATLLTAAVAVTLASSALGLAKRLPAPNKAVIANLRSGIIRTYGGATGVLLVQAVVLALATAAVAVSDAQRGASPESESLPFSEYTMLTLRATSLTAPLLPFFSPRALLPRQLSLSVALFTVFLPLCISWEALFFVGLAATLLMFSHLAVKHCEVQMPREPQRNGSSLSPRSAAVAAEPTLAPPPQTSSARAPAASVDAPRSAAPRRRMGRGARGAVESETPAPQQPAADVAAAAGASGSAAAADPYAAAPQDGSGQVEPVIGMPLAWGGAALIYCINLGFFGTGNMASVASFEPVSVLRLVTRFDKFIMGCLLMAKIVLPLLLVAAAFAGLAAKAGIKIYQSSIVVLLLSNVMALFFFFQVTSEGSWAVIGTSVSHFGVMNVQVVVVLLLLTVSRCYVSSLS